MNKKMKSLGDWKAAPEKVEAVHTYLNYIVRANNEMAEELNENREELREEIREEMQEQFEAQCNDILRENKKLKEEKAEYLQTISSLESEVNKLHHDFDVKMAAIRELFPATINNVNGNYIENQNIKKA